MGLGQEEGRVDENKVNGTSRPFDSFALSPSDDTGTTGTTSVLAQY